jgi:PAS domain S-box-containing protein
MYSPLRILHLEDDPQDSELVQAILADDGITGEVARIESEADFVEALKQGAFDLILADYTLPAFDGLSALKLTRQEHPLVPFIFVSGTLGEEIAIEALKIGATDYVFKTRLARIGPAVRRALREAHEKVELRRAEEALRRSETYLAAAQKLSQTGSFGWDLSSGEIYWSQETYRILGYEPGGKNTIEMVWRRTHPEDQPALQQLMDRDPREMIAFDIEHRLLMPDGTVKHVRVVGRPSRNESGRVEVVGAVTDITERKQSEEKLRRSEAELLEAQRISHTGSWKHDFSSGKVTISPEVHRMFGIHPGEGTLKAEFFFGRIYSEDRLTEAQNYECAILGKTDFESDYRIVLPDGSIKHIHNIGHPVLDNSGELTGYVGTAIDVTGARIAQEKIRQSERELRQVVDTVAQLVIFLSPDGRALYANKFTLEFTGLSPDDVKGEYFPERIFHPDDVERLREERSKALLRGVPFEDEQRVRRQDGQYRWFFVRYNALLDEQKRPTRWYAAGIDIEDRKQAEEKMRKENLALREEIDHSLMFEEIVGGSHALHSVLARVSKIAPTDSTVLITGETGTGKELFARAIHKRSLRSSRAFVSVNCAATPATLIASELFGHEKGAFTGALQRRLGRFELAEGGTLFLDEIGELPPETQIALLRVLQEREFDRVGGSRSIRADVRVIAATNRNLHNAIESGAFRKDLFYRLNVLPIEVPPLRERKEDVPRLIEYFVQRYARKTGKKIRTIEKRTLELLESYSWPGNVRELQNVIERSVIFCESDLFSVDPSWLSFEPSSSAPAGDGSHVRMTPAQEQETIEKALAASEGRVSGPLGAAAQLNMPASTLESKIRSLKINKFRFKRF